MNISEIRKIKSIGFKSKMYNNCRTCSKTILHDTEINNGNIC